MAGSSSQRATIIEVGLSGHRERYLRWTSEALIEKHYEVSIKIGSNHGISEQFLEWGTKNRISIDYVDLPLPAKGGVLLVGFIMYLRVRELIRQLGPKNSLVFFPSLDAIGYFVAICGLPNAIGKCAGIVMRPYFHIERKKSWRQGIIDKLKERLFYRLLKSKHFIRLFTIDELLFELHGRNTNGKLVYLADPAYLAAGKNNQLLDKFGADVLIYGSIDERKGIAKALASLDYIHEQKDPQLARVKFIVAGQASQKMHQLLEIYASRYPDNLHVINRRISDSEEYDLFMNAEIVWVAYENFFNMSGVLAQAGLAGKPVIGNKEGLISFLIKKYDLGRVVDINSSVDISETLKSLLGDPSRAKYMGRNGKAKFVKHSVCNFKQVIREAIDD